MQLRHYQLDAVQAVYDHLRSRDDNPCVVIPTGGGKTPVLAQICKDTVEMWHGRICVLAHVKELLEQAAEKLHLMAPGLPIGIYSAGLGRRDLGYSVTIAGIQSVYNKAEKMGSVDLIIIDEAHLIPPDGEGMYRRFLADAKAANPNVRVIGLTATPYRMKTGTICGPDNILNHVCYEIGVRELIVDGYLCPIRSKGSVVKADTSGLHTRMGEYVAGEVEDLMDNGSVVEEACNEIVEQTTNRQATLIFCAGVRHGRHVAQILTEQHGVECGFVCGDTPAGERATILDRFRDGDLHYMANVNVLTTGFDAPNIDCVAMLRPTLSPGLYYQMVGRGFRIAPDKTDCLILDFGGNVIRHGPVDVVGVESRDRSSSDAPAKECPQCQALIHSAYATCPECGHTFDDRTAPTHEATASSEGVVTGQVTREVCDVDSVEYFVHHKKNNPSAPVTMRVEYEIAFNTYAKEWVCFDHKGYARCKAEAWWRARSNEPVPNTVEEAVHRAQYGALAEAISITIERTAGEKFDKIIDYELGPNPKPIEVHEADEVDQNNNESITTSEGWEVPF